MNSILSMMSGAVTSALSGNSVANTAGASIGGSSKISINKITNANVYLNGVNLIGRAKEITGFTDFKQKFDDHKALGLLSSFKLWSAIEPAELKISWSSMYEDLSSYIYNPVELLRFQIRSSVEVYNSAGRINSIPFVAIVFGNATESTDGKTTHGEPTEPGTTISPTYKKLTFNNKEILEWDAMANIFRVGGKDVFGAMLDNMGAR